MFWYLWRYEEALFLVSLKKENLVEQLSLSFYRVAHPFVMPLAGWIRWLFSYKLTGFDYLKRCLVVWDILGRVHGFSSLS